jgi:hypothetical protein
LEAEEIAKLFQGSVLANTLLLACLVSILVAHLLSWLCGGRAKLRRTFITFAYMYAFVWPTLVIVLVLNAWFIRWTLGVPWVELPPLGVSQQIRIERTVGNIVLLAVPVTVSLWAIGFVGYGYVRAVMTAQKLEAVRACVVAAGNVLGLRLIEQPLASAAHRIVVVLDPIIGWLYKLL